MHCCTWLVIMSHLYSSLQLKLWRFFNWIAVWSLIDLISSLISSLIEALSRPYPSALHQHLHLLLTNVWCGDLQSHRGKGHQDIKLNNKSSLNSSYFPMSDLPFKCFWHELHLQSIRRGTPPKLEFLYLIQQIKYWRWFCKWISYSMPPDVNKSRKTRTLKKISDIKTGRQRSRIFPI